MPESASRRVAFLDDDVIAIMEPDIPGVIIAPRLHATGLATHPAVLLAALRKAALHVETLYGASGVTIEPDFDLPGAPGHVCYRVVPGARGQAVFSRGEDSAPEARRLAALLGDAAAYPDVAASGHDRSSEPIRPDRVPDGTSR